MIPIFIALTMTSCEKDVSITIKDENKTSDITIDIYNGDSDTFLAGGKTNNKGVFKDTIKAKSNDNIIITFNKEGYDIIPGKLEEKPTGSPLAINVSIAAELSGKLIEFIARNAIPNIQIYGVNISGGADKYLGKTNNAGILRTLIKKKDFPNNISFKYNLEDAEVVSESNISGFYTFENIPESISLKAIPNKDLRFYFKSNHDFEGVGLSNVHVSSEHTPESGYTDRHGMAKINIFPTEQDGPFIGDVIKWTARKDNFSIPEAVESKINVGGFDYPIPAVANPYTFTLRREYEMSIQVLEENYPVSDVEILVNGESLFKTNETGTVIFKYYEKDISNEIKFEVRKEGLSANPQTVTLGKIERSLTFNVETIHLYLNLVDSKTKKPISGLIINRNGMNMGESNGMGSIKVIFPKMGHHLLEISDPNEEYLKKTYSLNIVQDAIGTEYTVEVDPKTGVSFSLIDAKTGNALKDVQIYREGKKVGQTNDLGLYTEDFDPAPGNYYYYSFKADHYLQLDKKKIYRQPGRVKEEIELKILTATLSLKDDLGDPVPFVDIYIDEVNRGQSDDVGQYNFYPIQIGDVFSIKIISPDEKYVTKHHSFTVNLNEWIEHVTVKRQAWIELKLREPDLYDDDGLPLPGVFIISSTDQNGESDALGIFKYKVKEKLVPVDFSFAKSEFENYSMTVLPEDLLTTELVWMTKLEASFNVFNSKTDDPVKGLIISLNGQPTGAITEASGKGTIFPKYCPSNLDLSIYMTDNSYIPLKKNVKYNKNNQNLGKLLIEPKPIDVNVDIRWLKDGNPIRGTIEIDFPYQKYILKGPDKGKHTFNIYDKTIHRVLTITAQRPKTDQVIVKTHPIPMPPPGVFTVDVPVKIPLKPQLNVIVDPGVILEINHITSFGDTIPVITGHHGNYTGELHDYGITEIIRTGKGFDLYPSSTTYLIENTETTKNLTRQPNCKKAATLLAKKNWKDFVDQVGLLNVSDNCFPSMNKKAGEVSMERLGDYSGALKFYNNIVYNYTNLVIKGKHPVNDPYIYLRMLECSMESKQYKEGIRAAREFDKFRLILNVKNKILTICKKEYLLGLLMVDECYRLRKEINSEGVRRTTKIKAELSELIKETIAHLEMYQKTRGACPSLADELSKIRDF